MTPPEIIPAESIQADHEPAITTRFGFGLLAFVVVVIAAHYFSGVGQ